LRNRDIVYGGDVQSVCSVCRIAA